MTMRSRPILRTAGLSKHFGGLAAVSDLDLSLTEGQIHALIGPNGAGKSTALNLLSGITRKTSGTIEFKGKRTDGLRPSAVARIGIGRTFQVPRLFAGLTLIENVMVAYHCRRTSTLPAAIFNLRGARNDEKKMAEGAAEALELVGLSSESSRLGSAATFVQRRKIEIARALALNPQLLLLDEPAAGMNTVEMHQLTELFRALVKRGITILFIEHHMHMVMNLADHITVLNFGRKISDGTPRDVRNDPAVLAAYLGDQFEYAAM